MTPKESLSFVFSKVERFTPKVVIDLGNIALEGAINIATNAVKFVDTLSQALHCTRIRRFFKICTKFYRSKELESKISFIK
jgi:hypothetical protein